MTFAEYWEKNEPFGCNPEEVAELAWNAAIATRLERLEKCEALIGFADHLVPCPRLLGDRECTCGYDAARAALKGK